MKSLHRMRVGTSILIMGCVLLGACAPSATPTQAPPPAATEQATQPIAVPVITQPPSQPTVAPTPNESELGKGHYIAVVFAHSGLGDKSFNDSLFEGMVLAAKEFDFVWDYSEPTAATEYEPFLRSYAQTGKYDLIICNAFTCGSSLEKVAPDFPNQKFMIIDGVVEKPNVSYYSFKINELSYLVGVIAGLTTKTNKIGFIGAFDIPIVEQGAAGYKAGALSVNPKVEVLVGYVGAWDAVAGCKEMALAQNGQGADIIYHNASLGGLGMIEAGKDKGFLTVGFDGQQNVLAPDTNFLSAIRGFPQAARDSIRSVFLGQFSPGGHIIGVKEGGVYVTNDLSNVKIDPAIWAKEEAARQDIASGKLVVPELLKDVKTP